MEDEENPHFISSSDLKTNTSLPADPLEYIFDRKGVRAMYLALYSIVFFCCFFGNLTILVVSFHWRMRSMTNFCLANLAFADFCVGIFCVYQNIVTYFMGSWIFGEFMCKMYHFINSLSTTASVLILIVTCIERFLAIIHPIKCKQLLTKTRLRITILLVWILSAAFSSPRFYYFSTIKMSLPNDQYEILCLPNRTKYNSKLMDMISMTVLFLIPLTIIIILYTRIGIVLWKSSTQKVQITPPPSQNRKCSDCDSGHAGDLNNDGNIKSNSFQLQALQGKKHNANTTSPQIQGAHMGPQRKSRISFLVRPLVFPKLYKEKVQTEILQLQECKSKGSSFEHPQCIQDHKPKESVTTGALTDQTKVETNSQSCLSSQTHHPGIYSHSNCSQSCCKRQHGNFSLMNCSLPDKESPTTKAHYVIPSNRRGLYRQNYKSCRIETHYPRNFPGNDNSYNTYPIANCSKFQNKYRSPDFGGSLRIHVAGKTKHISSQDMSLSIHDIPETMNNIVDVDLFHDNHPSELKNTLKGTGNTQARDETSMKITRRSDTSLFSGSGSLKKFVAVLPSVSNYSTENIESKVESAKVRTLANSEKRSRRVKITRRNRYGTSALLARRKIVKMLIVIVLAFAICHLPFHARKVWQYWSPQWARYKGGSAFSTLFTTITFLIMYANSGLNPIFYAFMSTKFRMSFKDMLRCKLKRSFKVRTHIFENIS